MVSLWPWRGDDTSPASFEKTLSALATKITKLQTQQDVLHRRHRRYKALWTLYTSFAYLLCFIIAFLVIGWQNMSATEYTTLAGAPVIIYLIRTAISTYYLHRISTLSSRLDEQLAVRARTIEKLKAATKYDSTQSLLEKYGGGAPSTPKASPGSKPKKSSGPGSGGVKKQKSAAALGQRTGMSPPPTANIPRPRTGMGGGGEQTASPRSFTSPLFAQQCLTNSPKPQFQPPALSPGTEATGAEFAPNAFPSIPQYANPSDLAGGEGHWYDRILDLLLGEDETLPRNRLALICAECRLVNGLAPPGMRSLRAVGRWRCGGCGGWNGEERDREREVLESLRDGAGVVGGGGKKGERVADNEKEKDRTVEISDKKGEEDNAGTTSRPESEKQEVIENVQSDSDS